MSTGERELAALAVSLRTPCVFCASVHGRRHFLETRDERTATLLADADADAGAEALEGERDRAVARLAQALAAPVPAVPVDEAVELRGLGAGDAEIAVVGAVAAMFAWANRLISMLGEPVD
ncbi:carboxymuconolactone decarboxylase family protein [Brachybacterium nesterenkovii]|uniref:Alkylhydroperoxidase AhpD domain protein n=1 Tax=Brachybacterium nesterenkovii TaxID=47847 RepID=A0A1X6X9E4_9MICO|nr:carboxymuconolactone decarboxylase family protein [Brachybacterium nesterenkovii]SLM95759.1 Alkylhydroperoxidase AhpD domain protein [Brachybacterium nesterenkovii]